jgi:hypothetical protein
MSRRLTRLMNRVFPSPINPHKLALNIVKRAAKGKILSGPFAGMKYVTVGIMQMRPPFILGTHELELKPVIEELCQQSFDTIINVGAALGYYAVGVAVRCSASHVIAFEADVKGREYIMQMARLNKVEDRLVVQGLCDAPLLSNSISGKGKCLGVCPRIS